MVGLGRADDRRGRALNAAALILAASWLSLSCSPLGAGRASGSLSLAIADAVGGGGRTLYPTGLDLAVATYDIVATGPSGASFSQLGYEEKSLVESPLVTGLWTVAVTARNAAGVELGSGNGSKTVVAEQTVALTVTVRPLPGAGTLRLHIDWPPAGIPSPVIFATLTDAQGAVRDIAPEFTVDAAAGTADFAGPVAAGSHEARLKLKNAGYLSWSWGRSEALIVSKDRTTEGSFSIPAARLNRPPEAPTELQATSMGGVASLGWIDASEVEDDYLVESREGAADFASAGTAPENSQSWSETAANPGHTITYRVSSHNAWGYSPSASASIALLYPPADLTAPLDQAEILEARPTLDWSDSAFAGAAYRIQVAKDAAFASLVADKDGLSSSAYTLEASLENGATYHWRAMTEKSGGGYGTWSGSRSFSLRIGAGIDIRDDLQAPPTVSIGGYGPLIFDGESQTITATSTPAADLISWTLDGKPLTATVPGSITILADGLSAGNHVLAAKAVKGKAIGISFVDILKMDMAPYAFGETGPAGGYVFYDKGAYSMGWRFLEAAPVDQGSAVAWGGYGTSIAGNSEAVGMGRANTAAIVAAIGGGSYAAKICSDLSLGRCDDWFLPSLDELNRMYVNLKQHGSGNLASSYYWSSTENGTNNALAQSMSSGGYIQDSKSGLFYVRAIRAF